MAHQLTPAVWSGPLPAAAPPATMALFQIPTGTYVTRAALAFRGGSFRDKRDFAATALLVQHPEGDFLIDAGFGAGVAEHVAMLPRFVRAPFSVVGTVRDQLDAVGYDFDRLKGVFLTHSHWDHSSGLDSLDVPIWMNHDELAYAATDGDGKVYRSVSRGHEIHKYTFDAGDYLGFPASLDVHGDGSLVVAKAGGHTTGSVVVFVTLPTAKRYAFIGDLVWQFDGIHNRVERPWLLRTLADSDAGQVREGIVRAAALTDLMQVVPAHDRDAYAGIAVLDGSVQ